MNRFASCRDLGHRQGMHVGLGKLHSVCALTSAFSAWLGEGDPESVWREALDARSIGNSSGCPDILDDIKWDAAQRDPVLEARILAADCTDARCSQHETLLRDRMVRELAGLTDGEMRAAVAKQIALDWASETGRLYTSAQMAALGEHDRGAEHIALFLRASDGRPLCVIKRGWNQAPLDVIGYVNRLFLCNYLFNDRLALLGWFVEPSGAIQPLIFQPFYRGSIPSCDEVEKTLRAGGFESFGPLGMFLHSEANLLISDAKPDNWRRHPSGCCFPFDVQAGFMDERSGEVLYESA